MQRWGAVRRNSGHEFPRALRWQAPGMLESWQAAIRRPRARGRSRRSPGLEDHRSPVRRRACLDIRRRKRRGSSSSTHRTQQACTRRVAHLRRRATRCHPTQDSTWKSARRIRFTDPCSGFVGKRSWCGGGPVEVSEVSPPVGAGPSTSYRGARRGSRSDPAQQRAPCCRGARGCAPKTAERARACGGWATSARVG